MLTKQHCFYGQNRPSCSQLVNNRQTDRQFIQTVTYSTSSQHKLYNEICHVYLHICEIKNEQIKVSLTVTIEKKDI